jgi:hypothetical protein
MSDWKEELKQFTPAQALRNEEAKTIENVEKYGPSVARQIINDLSKGDRTVVLGPYIDRKSIEIITEDMKKEWIVRIGAEHDKWVIFFAPK